MNVLSNEKAGSVRLIVYMKLTASFACIYKQRHTCIKAFNNHNESILVRIY